MDIARSAQIDSYIERSLALEDTILTQSLERSRAAGLPAIEVSAAQGRMLEIFVHMCGARRILEIGTLGGYSSICMARALPSDGTLISLEFSALHARVAQENIAAAGLSQKVEVRTGPAVDSLDRLIADGQGPFDFIFIDADKPNNRNYLDRALRLSRPGTVIVCDNVIRDGQVLDASSSDANVRGARDVFSFAAERPDLLSTAIQTVGAKGYDGFAMMIVPG